QPKALLMDEPLSNLDYELNLHLRREILRLQDQLGFTLLYVTHDREEAFDIGTRVVVMKDGTLERMGSVEEIREYFAALARGSLPVTQPTVSK
ncbi:MAG: ABC transporter ATP-binding protein, partial [bacterium]